MARCLALLGMVATHVLDERTPTGDLTVAQALAGGRASALFAVLAGVSIALMTGRRQPTGGTARRRVSVGLAVRALLIAVIGLLLGELGSGIAVILTYYGLLFLVALLFIGLRPASLLVLVAGWVVVAPAVSHLVRPHLPERGFASPTLGQLVSEPLALLSELTFTGYYPVVPWTAYVLVGLAIGRLDLGSRRTSVVVAGTGAALAVGATALSGWLTALPSVERALLADPSTHGDTSAELLDGVAEGMFGTTPTGEAWQWLLLVTPHTGTPFDLVQTTGTALLVIGLCSLVAASTGAFVRRFLAVFFGAGTMTLTLYSLHVVLRTPGILPRDLADSYPFHVLVLMAIGVAYVALGQRGPLERAVGLAVRAASQPSGSAAR